jgi:hypothetical protein
MTENLAKDVGFVEIIQKLVQLEFKYSCYWQVRTVLCILASKLLSIQAIWGCMSW